MGAVQGLMNIFSGNHSLFYAISHQLLQTTQATLRPHITYLQPPLTLNNLYPQTITLLLVLYVVAIIMRILTQVLVVEHINSPRVSTVVDRLANTAIRIG